MRRKKLNRKCLTLVVLILFAVFAFRFIDKVGSAAVSTTFEGMAPGVYGDIIAFLGPAITANQVEILYTNINTPAPAPTPTTATGDIYMALDYAGDLAPPSVYDDSVTNRWIAFHVIPLGGGNPIIYYYDLSTSTLVNTGAVGRWASVYGDKIAFYTYEGWVGQDLNADGDQTDHVIRYWNIATATLVNTGAEGKYPSLYGDIIAFETFEDEVGLSPGTNLNPGEAGDTDTTDHVIRYYSISTGTVTNVGRAGNRPSIYRDIIAFETFEQEVGTGTDLSIPSDSDTTDRIIRYYNIPGTGVLVNTGKDGRWPSIWDSIITFNTHEPDITPTPIDLNGDTDTVDWVVRSYDALQGRYTADGTPPVPAAAVAGFAARAYGFTNGLTEQRLIAFTTHESWVGLNGMVLNGDGDTNDYIIRYVKVQMQGDVNGDGIVFDIPPFPPGIQCLDVNHFLSSWGIMGQNPLWNPRADVNGDSTVNAFDLYLISSNYGSTSPSPLGADVNTDGIVDMFDMYIAEAVFGATGNPNYNPFADLNDDGNVNIFDLAKIGQQWSNTLEDPPEPDIGSIQAVGTTVYVDPPSYTEKVGNLFTVNVSISDEMDLYGWQVGVAFNSSILQAINVTEGEFLKRKGVSTLWAPGNINNTEGTIAFSGGSLTGPPYGLNGTGQLMAITFNVTGPGTTSIHLTDGILLNSTLATMDAVFKDGTITGGGVAITKVKPAKTVVGQGFLCRINVTVTNKGDFTETFNTTAYADLVVPPIVDEIIIGTITVTLDPGNSTTLLFTWNTTGVAKGDYTISGYATPVQGEIGTTDNTYIDGNVTVAMIGDITGPDGWPDGKVDIRDIATIARHFGCNKGDLCYVPNYDLNCDGKIDIRDIATAAIHFGEVDP